MPWLDKVAALLQVWFWGQEYGNAMADVLTGAVNPEGRLPVSFPRYIENAPAHGNFPGAYIDGQLEVNYAEGVFVGYRHYDRIGEDKVNFPLATASHTPALRTRYWKCLNKRTILSQFRFISRILALWMVPQLRRSTSEEE